jgi:hypothetical protein
MNFVIENSKKHKIIIFRVIGLCSYDLIGPSGLLLVFSRLSSFALNMVGLDLVLLHFG